MRPLPPPPPIPRGVKPELHVLRHALSILEDPARWTRRTLFVYERFDPDAVGPPKPTACCSFGAIRFTCQSLYPDDRDRAIHIQNLACARIFLILARDLQSCATAHRDNPATALASWNDNIHREHRDVLRLFRRAIRPIPRP